MTSLVDMLEEMDLPPEEQLSRFEASLKDKQEEILAKAREHQERMSSIPWSSLQGVEIRSEDPYGRFGTIQLHPGRRIEGQGTVRPGYDQPTKQMVVPESQGGPVVDLDIESGKDVSGRIQKQASELVGDEFMDVSDGRVRVLSGKDWALREMEKLAKHRSDLINAVSGDADESALGFIERGRVGLVEDPVQKSKLVSELAGEGADVVPRYDPETGEEIGQWVRKPGGGYLPTDPGGFDAGDIADVSADILRGVGGAAGSLVGGVVAARKGRDPSLGAAFGGAVGDALSELAVQGLSDEEMEWSDRAKRLGFNVASGLVGEAVPAAAKAARGFVPELLPGSIGSRAAGEVAKREGLDAIERTGVELTTGQISKSRLGLQLEGFLRQMPWSSGIMNRADMKRIATLGDFMGRTVKTVAGADVDPSTAARVVGASHEAWAKELRSKAGSQFGEAMERANSVVGGQRVIPMNNYLETLQRLRQEYTDPTMGKFGQDVVGQIDAISKGLREFGDDAGNILMTPTELQRSLHNLRVKSGPGKKGIFKELDAADSKRHTKELHEALWRDLDAAIGQGGPLAAAGNEIRAAHKMYRDVFDEIEDTHTAIIGEIATAGAGREAVGRDITTIPARVMQATPKQIRKTVQVAERLDPAGAGQLKGAALQSFFDSATDKGGLSAAKLSTVFSKQKPRLKALLSGDKEAMDMLDDIEFMAHRLSEQPGANPSGTAQMLASLTAMSGVAGSIATGEYKALLPIAATIFSSNGLALVVNSKSARKIMKTLMDPPVRGWGAPQFTRAVVQLGEQIARRKAEQENQ